MRRSLAPAAMLALAAAALVLGSNLVVATSRYVRAYDAYDRLSLELDEFDYAGPSEPIRVVIGLDNPSGERLIIQELELTLATGVHPVGGGEVLDELVLGPRAGGQLVVTARIDDERYVQQLGGGPIDWQIAGRVRVAATGGADSEWMHFRARYRTEST